MRDAFADTVAARARSALASGALQPIDTEEAAIEDHDVRFVVRTVAGPPLGRAAGAALPKDGARPDPFRRPEAELVVGDVSATHVAVLNKYPVVDRHLLLVTRRFVDQEALLDRDDFSAFARCLGEVDWLGFYNGGREAGASQAHKHLQLVPLPFAEGPWAVPVEALFDAWAGAGGASRLLRLPFRNAFAPLEAGLFERPADAAAERLLETCAALLDACALRAEDDAGAANDAGRQAGPYNLLLTRRWMLLVPRSREKFGTISVNALGFAGSLFARDDAEMRALRAAGPMGVLRAVAVTDALSPPPGAASH